MFRITGYAAGSVIAVALMLLVLGLPELPQPEEPPVVVNIPPPPIKAADPVPAAAPADPPPVEVPEPITDPVEAEALPIRWHAFWSPFGSRIAANGFVSRLESVTGFDYRIVKVANGEYEVAFAYTSDVERDEILASIAAATGLELPGS